MEEKEFDCTVAFAIAGERRIGCFQVGDGSIVLRQNGVCKTVFLPEKGEYAFRSDGKTVVLPFAEAATVWLSPLK